MAEKPILLFLHGVGDGDQDDAWKDVLDRSLADAQYPRLDAVEVITPKYPNGLRGVDPDNRKVPGISIRRPSREEARQNRRDFERRVGAIEFRIGRHNAGKGIPGSQFVADFALGTPWLVQARNYATKAEIRAYVLERVLKLLPNTGRIVIVGHSLGSVIAADLIRRLPSGLEVTGLVTIGSPLSSTSFNVDGLREVLAEPPTNLSWWVNFWNPVDPVAARRGASSAVPWLLDFKIHTKAVGLASHYAVDYLSSPQVVEAIGFALFGSKSRELATVERGFDIPLNTAETFALLGLRYAHLIRDRLKGDVQDRYSGALRQVQASAVDSIREQNARAGRPIPWEISRLAFDLSDPEAKLPTPTVVTSLSREEAVVPLSVIPGENVIRPFDITVPKDVPKEALLVLSAEMGLTSHFGSNVLRASKGAQDALKAGGGFSLLKMGAIGAGAIAIVVATGGLALAAGAGLVGAAAITSALAAFGPGGMIGGLLTAGSLVTAGGGGIAFGLASPGTPAEAVEAVVARQLTVAILRHYQAIEQDPMVWITLTETEIALRREHERLDEFSDETSPTLKDLKRKLDAVVRAMTYMREHGLEPGEPTQLPA